MQKLFVLLLLQSIIVLASPLSVISNNFLHLVEAQPVSGTDNNSNNVTYLMKSNTENLPVPLENKTVTYFQNTSGYIAYPKLSIIENNISSNKENKLPGVVMIHENKGLNDHIKNMANLLAKEGFVVLAVDLFNGQVTTDGDIASKLAQMVRDNQDVAISNLKSAVAYLSSLPNVNPEKIASIGWCFGGQQSLQLALNSEEHPLSATVIYYGRLVTDSQQLSKIQWPILGIFGDQDKSIPVDIVKQFEESLAVNGIENEIYIYKQVGHAFANPSGQNYAPDETQDAWKKTISFLKKYL